MDEPGFTILLFDGVCNLCNGLVQFIIKRDSKNRFKFASLQSDSGRECLGKLGLAKSTLTSVVLIQGDQYAIKSTAVLKLLKLLGRPWSILYGFILIPRPVRDFFYDIIAKSRYRIFGKRNTCMIPTPDLEARFLQ
jgi:predicted DCC family thiol-disulfide oxidoreductase YuxK